MNEKLALVKELMSTAGNMEAFINSEKAKTPVFSTEMGNFYLCLIPTLIEVETLEIVTWCLCTIGYSKVLLEKAFGLKKLFASTKRTAFLPFSYQ